MPLRQGKDCGGEEDEEYHGEDDNRGEEYSGEDGRDKADRIAERTNAARRRTVIANRLASMTSAGDVVAVVEKQGRLLM